MLLGSNHLLGTPLVTSFYLNMGVLGSLLLGELSDWVRFARQTDTFSNFRGDMKPDPDSCRCFSNCRGKR